MVVDSATITPQLQSITIGTQSRVDKLAPGDLYFKGLVGMTNGSKQVIGHNTKWQEMFAGLSNGVIPRYLSVSGDQEGFYEIDSLAPAQADGSEVLMLKTPYCGPTSRAVSYGIWFSKPGTDTKEIGGGWSVVLDIAALPFEQMSGLNHNVVLLDTAIATKLGL